MYSVRACSSVFVLTRVLIYWNIITHDRGEFEMPSPGEPHTHSWCIAYFVLGWLSTTASRCEFNRCEITSSLSTVHASSANSLSITRVKVKVNLTFSVITVVWVDDAQLSKMCITYNGLRSVFITAHFQSSIYYFLNIVIYWILFRTETDQKLRAHSS